ncbi:MAG: hypothetical protein MUF07_18360 [Steroidobacteraceae bacterium]|jgi:hypothetical protein|nr:hypothetical protein [Steroidobacteraceae bacterium]
MSSTGAKPRVGALPASRRRAVHWIATGTWVTGAVWLVFKYFVRVPDEFGFDNPHPMQQWWLIAHAIVSVFAVWMFGVLWPGHVIRGWKSHLRRPTGGTLFGITAWLALTGLALYYVGNDDWRSWVAILHWAVGLGAIVAFLLHRRHAPRA